MKKLTAIFLSVFLIVLLCSCGGGKTAETAAPVVTAEAPASEAPAVTPAPAPVSADVMVLNGTTGFGMAKLMADAQAEDYPLDLSFSVETDASAVTAELISGDCDIAALPTNAAATLYNKTEGGIQIAAVNTRGVLYVVANTDAVTITSLAEMDGMTVYAPAQNPTWLFSAVADAAGISVTVDNTYAQPADLRTALAAGEIDIAVLPEPMVTIACSANEALSPVIDLTAEWDAIYPAGSLVQGCLVVRTEFAAENPGFMEDFLAAYGQSIAYLTDAPEDAAALIEQTGVFSNAAVAQKAIPNCNVCFLTGAEMKSAMGEFCSILYGLDPATVGGALPGDDFYFAAD